MTARLHSMWPTPPGRRCHRRGCGHTASDHDHYTSSTACACCSCPHFLGPLGAFLNLITEWP